MIFKIIIFISLLFIIVHCDTKVNSTLASSNKTELTKNSRNLPFDDDSDQIYDIGFKDVFEQYGYTPEYMIPYENEYKNYNYKKKDPYRDYNREYEYEYRPYSDYNREYGTYNRYEKNYDNNYVYKGEYKYKDYYDKDSKEYPSQNYYYNNNNNYGHKDSKNYNEKYSDEHRNKIYNKNYYNNNNNDKYDGESNEYKKKDYSSYNYYINKNYKSGEYKKKDYYRNQNSDYPSKNSINKNNNNDNDIGQNYNDAKSSNEYKVKDKAGNSKEDKYEKGSGNSNSFKSDNSFSNVVHVNIYEKDGQKLTVEKVDPNSTTYTTKSTNVESTGSNELSSSESTGCKPSEDLTALPENCHKFRRCANNILYIMDCPANLVFDNSIKVCNYPANVAPPCGTKY